MPRVPSAGARAPTAGQAGNCSALCGRGGEGAAQMWRGEPLCRISGVPQGPASPEPAEPALCRPAPGRSFLEGPRPPQVSAPSLQAAAQPGSPWCPEQTPPARSMAGLSRWAGTQTLPRPRGEEAVSRVSVAGPRGGAPSLTSSVGVEEAQGSQGTRHQQQQ